MKLCTYADKYNVRELKWLIYWLLFDTNNNWIEEFSFFSCYMYIIIISFVSYAGN